MPENAGTNSYGAYQTAQATRMNIAYIASNDGMVHGFRSGKYDSTGTVYDATTNDGLELLAYMPGVVLTSIAQNNATAFATNYNFTDPAYTHHFFVNASPGTGDLYYTNLAHLAGGWTRWWRPSDLRAGHYRSNYIFTEQCRQPGRKRTQHGQHDVQQRSSMRQ